MNRINIGATFYHMENLMKKHTCLFIFLFTLLLPLTTNAKIQSLFLESTIYNKKQSFDISLPESYSSSPNRYYPVIYVLHGQWDMPLVTSTVDVMSGEIPEFIVIGIHGKGKQLQPITEKNKKVGKAFRSFLHNELIPYVDKHYRIASYNILVGHSNSGRFAIEQMLTKNKLYKDYFVFSPSLEDAYLTKLAHKSSNLKGYLFISVADEGEHMETPFSEVVSTLKLQNGLTLNSKKYPDYSHQSSKIVALVNALQLRFSNWQPSYNTKIAGFEKLMEHYVTLKQEFGFEVLPVKDDIVRLIAYFAVENNTKEIKKFSQLLTERYSGGDESLKEIKDYLSQEGYGKAAKNIKI